MAERQSDLTRDTLAVVFLFVLIAASTWILLPFLTAVVWATMIVVATWPLLLMLQRWLLGRRWLAVTVMTLLLLAIFLLPFLFAIRHRGSRRLRHHTPCLHLHQCHCSVVGTYMDQRQRQQSHLSRAAPALLRGFAPGRRAGGLKSGYGSNCDLVGEGGALRTGRLRAACPFQ